MGGSVHCILWIPRFDENMPWNPVCLHHYDILFFWYQIYSTPIREFKKAVISGLYIPKAHVLVFIRSPITADILRSLQTVTAPKHTSTPLAYSVATVVLCLGSSVHLD
jgi:hypothetical protein